MFCVPNLLCVYFFAFFISRIISALLNGYSFNQIVSH